MFFLQLKKLKKQRYEPKMYIFESMQLSYKASSHIFVRLILLTFLISIFISFDLWGLNRSFPSFPIINIDIQNSWFHTFLQYSFIGTIVFCLISPKKKPISILLIFLILMISIDQLRLQSWVYFLGICFIPFVVKSDKKSEINYLTILFIVLYVWSGFHKLNQNFINFIFESILVDGFHITDIKTLTSLKSFGYVFPVIEVSIGVLLIFKSTRNIGVYFLIFTHLFIIYYIIFGLHGNYVILPWNIFMMIGAIILLYDNKQRIIFPKENLLKVILIIIALLPIGFLINKIDQSVSFSLYDGKQKGLYLLENESQNSSFSIDKNLMKQGNIEDYNLWSFKELNVPFYAEDRFIRKLKESKTDSINKFLLTDIPLWNRNLLGKYKNDQELKEYQKLDSLEMIVFKQTLFFPIFKIIE